VLVRVLGERLSGADSAAAWAIRPFSRPELHGAAARTLRVLIGESGRFGIVPSQDWGEPDPWTAPTAWSAWSLAALEECKTAPSEPFCTPRPGHRAEALRLIGDLRRAATPAGLLPERVDARTGVPRSTTPLAWSHAFTALALRSLWPDRSPARRPVRSG
jgi:GH15 family glucan-1,4-alpha-glucosidase